jgi:hypothetical protein
MPRIWPAFLMAIVLISPGSFGADRYGAFPHLAVGGGWTSDFFITNQGSAATQSIHLLFYNDDGAPMVVNTSLGANSSFTFNLAAGETKPIRTDASGQTRTGYVICRAPAGSAIRGSEVFRFSQGNKIITEAGVSLQDPLQHFSFPIEIRSGTETNSGVALLNPIIDSVQTSEQTIIVSLLKSDGSLYQSAAIALAPGQHLARYINQQDLFPGLNDFAGSLSISAPNLIGVVALRQEQSVFATVSVDPGPILAPFLRTAAPVAETEPNNSVAQAQRITVPVTISGTINPTADEDRFSFTASRGDILSFLVDTQTLASPLDSILELSRADGVALSVNDQNGLMGQNDSFAQVAIPADGTYFLRLRDSRGQGGSNYAYRLHIVAAPLLPRITAISPDRLPQGARKEVIVVGTNLLGTPALVFDPATGIDYEYTVLVDSTTFRKLITVAGDAPTGVRLAKVRTGNGESNSLSFTVTPRGSIPTISNARLQIRSGSDNTATLTGEFDFVDADGDIIFRTNLSDSSKIKISATSLASNKSVCGITFTGAYLGLEGQKSGHVSFTVTYGYGNLLYSALGFTASISLFDAAGNESNILQMQPAGQMWYCLVEPPLPKRHIEPPWIDIPRRTRLWTPTEA